MTRLGRIVGLVLAIFACLQAPAAAAPPSPADDSVQAPRTVAHDVLANDSDPDGDAMTVTAATQPANGSVTCSALGACFYRANDGFTGSDSFTYTVSDGGSTATATVSLNVTGGSSAAAIAAVDDDAATMAGQGVDINVLANDLGASPLQVVSSTSPRNGTATCSAGGACRYEPAPGFSGRDGFTYVLEDGSESSRTASVRIAVAPAGAAWSVTATGSSGTADGIVPSGGMAAWSGSAIPTTFLASDELRALGLPGLGSRIDGLHARSGDVRAAQGWTVSGDGAVATRDALLGEARSQVFPKPLPPISQGTGGDGHVPILVGSKVFAFFHHQHPTRVTCVDRATGAVCPGYPKQLNVGASDINGPAVVVGTKIWWHAWTASSFAQSASIGLHCWDAASDSACGMTIVDRVPSTQDVAASHPVLADNRIWLAARTGKLYCVEAATGAPCATPFLTTGLVGGSGCTYTPGGPCLDIVTYGNRVYASLSGDEVACLNVAGGTACPGWDSPRSFGGHWNLVKKYAGGVPVGVCVVRLQGVNGDCVDDAAPQTVMPVSNFPPGDSYHYHATAEAETGTRTFFAQLLRSGLGCYDWTTMAPCTGGGYDSQGWLDRDENGNSLSSAYGSVFDGACVIALGDPGQVFTVDPAGSSPCTSLSSGSGTGAIDLRAQRCDQTIGGARWRSVVLTDSDGAELDSLTATVRDARTGAVVTTGNLVAGPLDLSGVDPAAHPALVVDASVTVKGESAPWDDGIPPRIVVRWDADPKYLCVDTRGSAECSPASPSTLGFDAVLTGTSTSARRTLPLRRNPCGRGEAAPQKRACGGKRVFNIRVRYPGRKIRSVKVLVRGKRQKVLKLRPRPVVRIDLRKLKRQKVTVFITIKTKAGKTIRGKRTYRPCSKRHIGGVPPL